MASLNHARTFNNSSRIAANEQAGDPKEQVLWKLLLVIALTYMIWSDNISIILGPVSLGDVAGEPEGERVKAAIFDFSPARKEGSKRLAEVEVVLPPNALNNV